VLGHEDVQNNDYKDYKSFLVSLGSIWRQWLPLEALQTFEKGNFSLSMLLFVSVLCPCYLFTLALIEDQRAAQKVVAALFHCLFLMPSLGENRTR
jgi:hypothetical protein